MLYENNSKSREFSMVEPVTPRIIFVGDSGVGKTSLIYRAKYNKFNEGTAPTIGAGITKMEATHNGVKAEFQLWDTAGQEIYRSIVPMYFKGVCGAIIVFSFEDRSSFLNLGSWIDELLAHSERPIKYVVVGNKIDCLNQTVSQVEARNWANDRKAVIIFTSAITGENVELLLEHVVNNFVFTPMTGDFIPQAELAAQPKSCC
ncbi:GTP-binding protein ypt3 [Tritrichomonas foetus]|uniref:GTP-binding protein ypt3 n=1 Tax=Tritrichomonas foetus TaxID=1144522 RepID=A0A1J4KBW9_9EUKA|nr:GTP-binding protein ypt3 [Tritrichomonas foetus]|eukprot:OHT07188.1 GTP-binding protein ypt3 [Tritrichomonas foetus]